MNFDRPIEPIVVIPATGSSDKRRMGGMFVNSQANGAQKPIWVELCRVQAGFYSTDQEVAHPDMI